MAQTIFRQAALERLSSPERLDQLIQVTSPRSWIALLALAALLLLLLLWSVFGTVKTQVDGQGFLLGGGVYDIVPTTSGRVIRLAVNVGDDVEKDQVVLEVSQFQLEQQQANAQARLNELRAQHRELQTFGAQDVQLQMEAIGQQQANLEAEIAAQEERLVYLTQQEEIEENLLAQGLITRQQLLDTRQSLNNTRNQIEKARADLKQISAKALSTEFNLQQQLTLSRQRISEAERLLTQLEGDYQFNAAVRSPYAGRILEMMVGEGGLVAPGEPVMKVGIEGGETERLRAVLYVPSKDGKKIREGMQVQIAPATVKPEEYGFMVGRVAQVADFPSTTQGMMHVLRNDQIVNQIVQQGTSFEVFTTLEVDPEAPSGYRWTSALGPPLTIHSGTPCGARITVSEQRPIDLVLPALKKAVEVY